MNPHKYALLWRDAVTSKETVVMSATFGSSHAIRPGGRLLSRSFPTRQQFALVGSKTVGGDVGRQCQAYVLGVKAVERLLTSVQFFASAPPYRKAVVFTKYKQAFALTYK